MNRLLTSLACLLALATIAGAREFQFGRDTFAFSNDTVMRYGVDEEGRLHISRRDKPVEYGHRCFVLARAVMQFHQFARFEPRQPKLTREEYRRRIQQLCRIPVWSRGPRAPIVFPGFPDLRSFSIAYEGLLKETLGNWWPSYLRVGNWRMAMGHPRVGQAAAGRWLTQSMAEGKLRAALPRALPAHEPRRRRLRRASAGQWRRTLRGLRSELSERTHLAALPRRGTQLRVR